MYDSDDTEIVVGDVPRVRMGSLWLIHISEAGTKDAEKIRMKLKASNLVCAF